MDATPVSRVAVEACDSTTLDPKSLRNILLVDLDDEIRPALADRFGARAVRVLGEDVPLGVEDLFLLEPGVLHFIAVTAYRPARELYRVLALASRALVPGGLLFLPSHGSVRDRARFEASEVLCALDPRLLRVHTRAGVFMLRNGEVPKVVQNGGGVAA